MERYEAYKDSGIGWIGEIPESWDCCEIAYLSTCGNGATPSRDVPSYWNGNIPWMASGEIHQGYVTVTAEKITEEGLNNSSTRILPINTVMVALNGQGKTKGTAAILGIEACSNQSLAGFICNEYALHYRWLYYCFKSMYSYLRGESGQAQRDGISASSLKHEKIPLPPLAQQQIIANYLDAKTAEINALVADCEQEVELLREYRKAVISEAVTKGLNPDAPMKDSGIEWIGEIPAAWRTAPLCEVSYIRARLGWRALKAEEYVEDGYPMYSAHNIVGEKFVPFPVNYITESRYLESPEIMMNVGDIMLVKDGAGVGKCAVIRELNGPCTVNGSIALITPDSSQDSRYLYYFFESNAFQHFARMLMGGMGVPHLFQRDIKNMRVVQPDLETQAAISDALDIKTAEIDSLIEAKQSMADKLREYRKSLISEAVTGKFKVPRVQG